MKAVVFDRHLEIGFADLGIPQFKLEKQVMERRREVFEGMGVEFQLNTEIGRDITIDELMEDYDAVFLGMAPARPCRGSFPVKTCPAFTRRWII